MKNINNFHSIHERVKLFKESSEITKKKAFPVMLNTEYKTKIMDLATYWDIPKARVVKILIDEQWDKLQGEKWVKD